jgi:hypothetical protein
MYREQNGQHYFVGDPTPFHYEGPRFAYYGAHPVVDAEIHFAHPVYCYMKGPHYHWYQPPPQAQFQLTGGAYWYVGRFPSTYYDDRPRFAVVNEAYAPMPYVRPVVDIHVAPAVVQAEVSVGGPGWSATAVFGAPALPVIVPPVAAVPVPPIPVPVPPIPVPMLPVPVPGGVSIGVGVGLGGPAVVERRDYLDGRYRHDHGRHEGWRGQDRLRNHGHRPPPSPFAPRPAPAQPPPSFRRTEVPHPFPSGAYQRPAPTAARGPAPAPAARGPMPTRGPAPGPAPATRGPAPGPSHGAKQDQRH